MSGPRASGITPHSSISVTVLYKSQPLSASHCLVYLHLSLSTSHRELIRQVPGHQVVQHAAADTLQIQLPNGEEVQSQGKVTLEANIGKL